MKSKSKSSLKWFQKKRAKMYENQTKIDQLMKENERIAHEIYRKALHIDT